MEFGSVNANNFQNLQNIATVVQHSEGVSSFLLWLHFLAVSVSHSFFYGTWISGIIISMSETVSDSVRAVVALFSHSTELFAHEWKG